MILVTRAQIRDLVERSRTVAMVGASATPARPSHDVFVSLRARGHFEVTPINPALTQIDGVATFPSLAAYSKERGSPDIVDVFRKSSEAMVVTREAIAVGARAIWYQLGVVDQRAIELADRAGLDVVVDRCLKTES